MDLRGLECFLRVAEEGSISRAAVRLHMTQPPLTVRLQALEREIGVPLLVRHGRGVELTAAGRLLADRARRLLADLTAMTEMVRAVGLGSRGRLTVAAGHTVAPRLLARLAHDECLGPDVDLGLVGAADIEVTERVRSRDVQAGLLHLPPVTPGAGGPGPARGLEVAVVVREPLMVVLPAAHPAAADECVDPGSLCRDELVAVAAEVGRNLGAHVEAAWTAVAGHPGARHEAGSVTQALAMVEAGAGVTLLPAAYRPLVWDGLVMRPLRRHTGIVETAVVWRSDEYAPVLRRFLRAALSTPEPDVLGPEHARVESAARDR